MEQPPGSRLGSALYDPFLWVGERLGMRARRAALLAGARGRVLEIGAGTGLNLAHYPPQVAELVLTEPYGPMARRLAARAGRVSLPARVVQAGAEKLPFDDATFDVVVSTLVLCTVPEPAAAVAEVKRVLRPDGRLLFVEHVRAPDGRLARWQDRLAPPWRAFADGCNCNRATLELIEQHGLELRSLRRERWRGMPPIVGPLVIGEAAPV